MFRKAGCCLIFLFLAVILYQQGCKRLPVIEPITPPECKSYGFTSGPFPYKWYDYYEGALSFAEGGCWEQAKDYLNKAIKQKPEDQWNARTYGRHFIDYFPNREMGIAYYYLAQKEKKEEGYKTAVEKLEESLSQTPSAKAIYYLEKVYQEWIALNGKEKLLLPEISVQPFWTKDEPVVLSGTVEDKKYIRKIGINIINKKDVQSDKKLEDESFEPVFILNSLEDFKRNLNESQLKLLEEKKTLTDLTTNVSFKKQFLFLPQGEYVATIRAENIMGGVNDHKVDIRVDRLGPMITVADKKYTESDKELTISGFLGDESGISSLFMNNQQVPVKADNSFEAKAKAKADEKEVELVAVDQLGNQTKIDVSLASNDVEALHASVGISDRNDTFLASNGSSIIETNLIDNQIVYGDKMYIEVEIKEISKHKIRKVIVNDHQKELTDVQQKAESFFFIEEIEIKDNKIVVKAMGDNKSEIKEIPLIKREYEAYQNKARLKILVFPFEKIGNTDIETEKFQNMLTEELSDYTFDIKRYLHRFRLPSYDNIRLTPFFQTVIAPFNYDKINEIKSKAKNEEYRCIIVGSIEEGKISRKDSKHKDDWGTEIVAKLYDTEDKNYMDLPVIDIYLPSRKIKENRDDYYKSIAKDLAKKVYVEFPLITTDINEKKKKKIITKLDNYHKIKKNAKVSVHSKDKKEIKGQARVLEIVSEAEVEKEEKSFLPVSEHSVTTE